MLNVVEVSALLICTRITGITLGVTNSTCFSALTFVSFAKVLYKYNDRNPDILSCKIHEMLLLQQYTFYRFNKIDKFNKIYDLTKIMINHVTSK